MTTLLVEGKLDQAILSALIPPTLSLTVEGAGSKWTLAAKVKERRARLGPRVAYLRDRDFDFEPPEDTTRPTPDVSRDGQALGWRWARHELESYLLEPALAVVAMGFHREDFEQALLEGALAIQDYQAARWLVGRARRSLPPAYQLETRPADLKGEFQLPDELLASPQRAWVLGHLGAYYQQVQGALEPAVVEAALHRMQDAWAGRLRGWQEALLWCSGKDLLAALSPWLKERGVPDPSAYRAAVRDWVISNPDAALALVPEWRALIEDLGSA